MASSSNRYNLPTSLRVPTQIPADVPEVMRPVISTIFNTLQQIAQLLSNQGGMGQRNTDQWNLLNGSHTTLNSGNLNRFYAMAKGNSIPLGAAITINPGSPPTISLASAFSSVTQCDGFCTTTGGISNGQVGEVILNTGTVSVGGLISGSRYYLSVSPGVVSLAPTVAPGQINQFLGIAIDNTNLFFTIRSPVVN
jgi:hypothetical protein